MISRLIWGLPRQIHLERRIKFDFIIVWHTLKSPHTFSRLSKFLLINILVYFNFRKRINFSAPQKNTQSASSKSLFQIPTDLTNKIDRGRMVLVMDLDETMVYTRRKTMPKHNNFISLHIDETTIYVEFRPHIGQFLHAASQMFTIYVYTAGSQPYADAVIDSLPNSNVISRRFYRESCIHYKGRLIKDLQIIRKSLNNQGQGKQPILVDDNGISISYNSPNSVKIRAFEGNQQDCILVDIFTKLIQFYRIKTPDKKTLQQSSKNKVNE